MDIEKMREFIVLANVCNYEIASNSLFTTSSTLSKHIMQLEHELGCQLFVRSTRKVSLSEAGLYFLDHAEKIVAAYDHACEGLSSLTSSNTHTLSICFIEVMRQYGLVQIISDFLMQHPEMNVRMLEATGQSLNALLQEKSCDFAFASRLDLFDDRIARQRFERDELVLIVPRGHPLAAFKSVRLQQLQNETFALHDSYYEKDAFCAECRRQGFSVKSILISSNSATIFDMVLSGTAISVMSRARCQHSPHLTDIVIVNLEPRIQFYVYLLWLKGRTFTPEMRTFSAYIAGLASSRSRLLRDGKA